LIAAEIIGGCAGKKPAFAGLIGGLYEITTSE
jgi:hypothetical protein